MFTPSDPLDYLFSFMRSISVKKPPIAVVVRPDIYARLRACFFSPPPPDKIVLSNGIPVFPDPAAHNPLTAQTEEGMLFYDNKTLALYLNRAKDPIAWVKHVCECAKIPCPDPEKEEDIGRQFPPAIKQEHKLVDIEENKYWYL